MSSIKQFVTWVVLAVCFLSALVVNGESRKGYEEINGVVWYYSGNETSVQVGSGGNYGIQAISQTAGIASGEIVVPDRLGGIPVTAIAGYAFSGMAALTRVTIPSSVTTIGG